MFILSSVSTIRVFAEDDDTTTKTIQLLKTIKIPHDVMGVERDWFSFMNTGKNYECFLPDKMMYFKEYPNNQESNDSIKSTHITIYSILSNSLIGTGINAIYLKINNHKRATETFRLERQNKNLERFKADYDNIMSVSPTGSYILFRFSPFASEIYRKGYRDIKLIYDEKDNDPGTNRRLDDNEMIIGFGPDPNLYDLDSDAYKAYGPACTIYCYRPSLDGIFLLRDARAGEVLKTYNTELLVSVLSWKTENRLNYQPYYVPQTTSDGRYTVFYLISSESEYKGLVVICDNEKNCVVANNSVNLDWPYPLRPLIRHDDKFIAIPSGEQDVLVYDFDNRSFHTCRMTTPPARGSHDSRTIAEREMKTRGFSFLPDHQLVIWKTALGIRKFSDEYFQPCLFDFETYKRTPLEDFLTPGFYTCFIHYNVSHDMVITFETTPEEPYMNLNLPLHYNNCIGKYVFWDSKTKKRIFETEEKYHPNIIVTPDGNQVYLTSKERCYEFYQTATRMLALVDVFEIR